ncbi:hypothetical protein GW17_00057907 [Ensete ventricosum]|nr:hypothetical protein GW17_00057907 [Ensete ventricosum]
MAALVQPLACGVAACMASAARGCLRVWPPVDAAASVCSRRLMRLPLRSTDPAFAWAVGSVVNAADLYAHSMLS